MIVLSFPAATAERIVRGEQTVVTYAVQWSGGADDLRLLVGQAVAIARLPSTTEFYTQASAGEPPPIDTDTTAPAKVIVTEGAIVGSATVATVVVQVLTPSTCPNDGSPHLCLMSDGTLLRYPGSVEDGYGDDITDQLPYIDATPGRWAVILTDAAPCEQRCAARIVDTSMGWRVHPVKGTCPHCDGKGKGAPIPYRATDPIGEWTP